MDDFFSSPSFSQMWFLPTIITGTFTSDIVLIEYELLLICFCILVRLTSLILSPTTAHRVYYIHHAHAVLLQYKDWPLRHWGGGAGTVSLVLIGV